MTNPTAGGGAEGYRPDPRLKGIYRQADELDDEALQTLCPSFSELAAVETRYTQKMLIGKGALKAIYRCFDERTQRFVALARPRAEHGADCYDDFVHEAWLVCALRHPNIIKVHDAGVDTEGRPYFTMDLKGGSTLADVVNQGTALRPLLAIFLKICDAVAYAHAEGIIHRDLKPENIQCARFGEVLVCDWGLGKFVHESGRDVAGRDEVVGGAGGGVATASGRLIEVRHMTAHGDIKGSPGFMAPEQIQPGGVCDDRSDGFALGCLLHFILTGEAPFTGTREEILAQTVEPSRKSPRRAYPGKRIPKSLDAVVLKAIAADPRDRYESVTGLQTDVSSFLAGHGTTAERPGVLRRAGLFVKRNKTPVSIAAAALGVLTLSGFLFLAHAERKEREARIERARSQLLSTEFDALSAEYEELMNQSEETREEWAEKLTISAIRKKSASVFTRPKVPFRDVRALIAKALELDPESAEARFQYFSNCCIMLDFEEAMKHPVDPQHRMAGYMNYVAAFPGFDYSEERRPAVDELTRFFKMAKTLGSGHVPLITAILTYDADARSDKTHYAQVVGAALEYLAPAPDALVTGYSPDLDELRVKMKKGAEVNLRGGRGAGAILRFLQVDSLVLEVEGRFDLGSLQRSSVKRLDVSKVQSPVLKKRLLIKGLEEVVIRKDQSGATWLRFLLTSDGLSRPKVVVAG